MYLYTLGLRKEEKENTSKEGKENSRPNFEL